MIIGGESHKLRYSVYADCAIRELTEDGADVSALFSDAHPLGTRLMNYAKVAVILNRSAKRYEAYLRGNDPDDVKSDFSEHDFLSANKTEIANAISSIAEAIVAGNKRTVFTRSNSKSGNENKTEQNRAWFVFLGHELNMSREETLNTIYGEMCDQVSLLSVYNRTAELIDEPKKLTFEEIMELR